MARFDLIPHTAICKYIYRRADLGMTNKRKKIQEHGVLVTGDWGRTWGSEQLWYYETLSWAIMEDFKDVDISR